MPRKRKKIVPMKYPVGVEYSYRTSLHWLTHQLKLALKKHLAPVVPEMVLEVSDIHAIPTGKVRQDARRTGMGWHHLLNNALHKIGQDMMQPVNKTIRDMQRIGGRVNDYNKEEWRKLIRRQYGVNPTAEQPDKYNDTLRNWAHNNALLIKDIPAKTMLQIRDETVTSLQSGKPVRDMANDIFDIMVERTDVSDSRATLIARDQTAKLNGQLTMERQVDMGIDSYTWRTVGDERVRETHASVDGEVFQWDSPPSETDDNHPGEDYQCRCWAEPVLPELMDFQASLLEEDIGGDDTVDTEEEADA